MLLEDIVRADAPATLKYFADQGVIVKVISGDNNVTVGAVARRAGLVGWENNIDATTMPPRRRPRSSSTAVEASTVFGRVTPHQKRSMVLALAVTRAHRRDDRRRRQRRAGVEGRQLRRGDGAGSEATRGVAQLVLMDSNFSAMPSVVAEGRRVINNIERVASLFLAKTAYSRGAVGDHRCRRARLSTAADPPVDPQLVHDRRAGVLPRPRAERRQGQRRLPATRARPGGPGRHRHRRSSR